MELTVIVIILLLFAAFTGLLMETYKKGLRMDKAGVWEIRLVAFALSLVYGFLTWECTDASVMDGISSNTPWLIAPYTVAVYVLQKPACMKVWKPLLKKWVERM